MSKIDFSGILSMVIPEGEVRKIVVNGTTLWQKPATNQIPRSIDTDGSIYNGTGYKNGYRIRSGGAETATEGAACSGFIPVKPGDVIRWTGWNFMGTHAANAINVSNASFVNLGQFTSQPASYGVLANSAYDFRSVTEDNGVWAWTVPAALTDIAYLRITGYQSGGVTGDEMILTINEEIS